MREHLDAYQGPKLTRRFDALVARFTDPALREVVARSYHKLLTYKDEYEVARLHLGTAARLAESFEGDLRLSFHLAPPILGGTGADGRPKKRRFGPWMLPAFRVLAALKGLRGTPLDLFGYSAERRAERALIAVFEADMDELLALGEAADPEQARRLAELPMEIRGYGPVKEAAERKAAKRREELLATIRAGGTPLKAAAE